MRVEMKYKDILFEVIGETSINNYWKLVGVSLSDLLIFDYDNPYRREISKINKDDLKRHKEKYKYLEDAHEKWINENSCKINKSSFVYDGEVNIEINRPWLPFPIYMPTSEDFDIPDCASFEEFDISKMKVYIKRTLIDDSVTGTYHISKIEYNGSVVYRNLFLDYF